MAAPVRRQPSAPQPAPAAKKKSTVGPAISIPLFVLLIGLMGWFIYKLTREEPKYDAKPVVEVVEDTSNAEWVAIQADAKKAKELYREVLKVKDNEDQRDEFKRRRSVALDAHNNVLERYEKMIEPLRDPKTGKLPASYLGYSQEMSEVMKRQSDLGRMSTFD
ncbi:MAG: hypothetical protein ACKVX7_04635 [Planctomycetota bacterium]